MAISLQNIANHLHLSKTTISWVLSGKGEEKGVSKQTIKLVQAYAKEIGYQPNLVARSLSVGYTQTIGLIIPAIGDTFYSQLIQAIESRANTHNFTLMVCSSERNKDKERELIQTLRSQRVAGLIIASASDTAQNIASLMKDNYPFVLIDRFIPQTETNYVIVDNSQASYKLTIKLADLGCKKTALITTETHLQVMNMRINGYRQAIEELQHEPFILEINRADYIQDLHLKLDSLLKEHNDIDGFFFSTHYLAIECIRYFIQHNIDYNQRYKMACFHTTTALDLLAPDMIYSLMPINQMGTEAVDTLLSNIQKKQQPSIQQKVLECVHSFFTP